MVIVVTQETVQKFDEGLFHVIKHQVTTRLAFPTCVDFAIMHLTDPIRALLSNLLWVLMLPIFGREYVVPAEDVAGFFARMPEDATVVTFSAAATYRCNFDIVLPDRQLLVIDGSGAKLVLGPNSNGFTRRIPNQTEAMRRVSSRYVIKDFASIEGGLKGVDLAATLGSTVSNIRFHGQAQVAVDLRFCLLCRLEMLMVTNPLNKGIVLRQGDWSGASATNSQCNSSVLDQCRVYCSASTTRAFSVHNSGGVRVQDCISEGHAPEHDLFLSAVMAGPEVRTANNPVVKSFMLSSFHVEHRTRVASIHVNMPSKAVVNISNVYWNAPQGTPVIDYYGGQLNISDIGWFTKDMRIRTRVSAPRISVERSHNFLHFGVEGKRSETQAGVLILADALPGNSALKLDHVRVSGGSR